jgi:four helix bundle protein
MSRLYYEYDLEQRTTDFAKRIVRMCKELIKDEINRPLISQVIRAGGSIGANYREANDALGNKDFIHRMKIARKECKECLHWIEIIEEANLELSLRMQNLKQEAVELKNILSSIIVKKENKN